MLRINRHFVWSVFLILVVIVNLMNVNVVLADDSTPPPTSTEEPTQPPVEATETPTVVETPSPTETSATAGETPTVEESPSPTETPVITEQTTASDEQTPADESIEIGEVLQGLPENADVVVLDENGAVLPLGSQDAAEIILDSDPMWCPVVSGVPTLPGGAGCTSNFASPQLLINSMDSSNPASSNSVFEQNGIIYFTTNPGGSMALVQGSGNAIDTNDYNVLKSYDLTFQGGWNGSNGGAATFTGQTNFGANTLTVGTAGNPWVGNITLTNFTFSGVTSSNAVMIYTTSGDITLNNVDIAQQAGGNQTALLDSNSGDITVQNGSSFDGNNTGNNQNRGFSADTATGSITISDTSFTDARGCGAIFGFCIIDGLVNYNGATLSAPTVTLSNVTADNNDLSGIQIDNANTVNLNNVTANGNGTLFFGSGVNIQGTGSTLVNISGGTFNNNAAYGVSVFGGALNVSSPMVSCTGNTLGCTNDAVVPVLTLPANITVQATGPAGAVVTYSASATDNVDGTRPVTCTPASGSIFAIATTTVNCSASDTRGNTANGSFTVTVQDTTPPTLTLPANITQEATSASGNVVIFTTSANDVVDGARLVTCVPPSGSTFPITTTTVNCSASDTRGNTASGSFTVTVEDTTAPSISPMADIAVITTNKFGAFISYAPPATFDTVDGLGVATCIPASGTFFPLDNTTVACTATDSEGNTSSLTFNVYVDYDRPARPGDNGSSGGIILVTGGVPINLDCNMVVNAFGVIVKFHNLCNHQAVIAEVPASSLPGALPNGFTFVQGLDVQVLLNGEALASLPEASGVEMDFPLPDSSEYAVLYWDNGQWVEITQSMNVTDLLKILSTDAAIELYKMSSSGESLNNVLTTDLTGTFVLVKK